MPLYIFAKDAYHKIDHNMRVVIVEKNIYGEHTAKAFIHFLKPHVLLVQ